MAANTSSSYIRTLFRQFPFLAACRFALLKTLCKFLDSHFQPSYSQTGEDRIIRTLLHGVADGFYVDVGCNQPQARSNTFELYKRGWRGINIDGNADLIARFHALRPRDTSLCRLVSNEEKEVVFTQFEDDAVSSLSAGHVEEWKKARKVKSERRVKTVSLATILRENSAPKRFELLTIDVEGHDFEVLTSFDLNEYRPRLIVIEMHGFEFLHPENDPIYRHLTGNGYRLAGYAVMNGYFLDSRD